MTLFYPISIISLVLYGAWITWILSNAKSQVAYLAADIEIKEKVVKNMGDQLTNERASFEKRLNAKQKSIEELKRKLLLNVRPASDALGGFIFPDGLPEDDNDDNA